MAVTPGLTGIEQTVAGSDELMFQLGTGDRAPTVLVVRVRSTSPVGATVRIPELHGSSGGAFLPPGEKEYFRVDAGGISVAFVSGATAVVDWYPAVHMKQI